MCGISFILNYGGSKIPMGFYQTLFENLSKRGRDASGYYFERNDGTKLLFKAPVESDKLWGKIYEKDKLKKYRLDGTETLVLMHARARTRGTQWNNKNNMPISSENYVLVHNGIITSEKIKDYAYKAEVDSEEILARIEKLGVRDGIKDVSGGMSIIVRPKVGDVIYLYRNSNPMDVVYLIDNDILVGCSEQSFIPIDENYFTFSKNIFSPRISCLPTCRNYLYTISTKEKKIDLEKLEEVHEYAKKN